MFVYFIRSGTAGPIKIGVADDPRERVVKLQIGNPEELTLLAYMPGGTALEARLHRRFRRSRIRGEWFHPTPALHVLINEAAATSVQLDLDAIGQTLALLVPAGTIPPDDFSEPRNHAV